MYMARGQTFILRAENRGLVRSMIDGAPDGHVVNVAGPARTADQNAKMWAMLSDISRAAPEGRKWTAETWKCAFMQSLGHQCQFAEGLDDSGPFPIGFRTSKLKKRQMIDLITVIYEYGDRHGVAWSEPAPDWLQQ
jgi:hypothetical protein